MAYFYRINSPALRAALSNKQVWSLSLFDGDATLERPIRVASLLPLRAIRRGQHLWTSHSTTCSKFESRDCRAPVLVTCRSRSESHAAGRVREAKIFLLTYESDVVPEASNITALK